MLKMLPRLLTVVILIFTVNSVFAVTYFEKREIKRVITYKSRVVIQFKTESNAVLPAGCTKNDYITIATTDGGGKQMLATILTAYAGDKPVAAVASTCFKWGALYLPVAYGVVI